jgi:hypothetical protein
LDLGRHIAAITVVCLVIDDDDVLRPLWLASSPILIAGQTSD